MRAIVLAFTMKGQPVDKILAVVKKLGEENPNAILIHGFMPRKVVEQKGFDTAVTDALAEAFPVQLNMYKDGPLREDMADAAVKLEAQVIVIGEVKEGVAEEVELYRAIGMPIFIHELG